MVHRGMAAARARGRAFRLRYWGFSACLSWRGQLRGPAICAHLARSLEESQDGNAELCYCNSYANAQVHLLILIHAYVAVCPHLHTCARVRVYLCVCARA